MRQFIALVLGVYAFVTPLSATAQSETSRMQAILVTFDLKVGEVMADYVDSKGGNGDAIGDAIFKEEDWTAQDRATIDCVMQAYLAEVGPAAVNQMLLDLEAFVAEPLGLSAGEEIAELVHPPGINILRSAQLRIDCGMGAMRLRHYSSYNAAIDSTFD